MIQDGSEGELMYLSFNKDVYRCIESERSQDWAILACDQVKIDINANHI